LTTKAGSKRSARRWAALSSYVLPAVVLAVGLAGCSDKQTRKNDRPGQQTRNCKLAPIEIFMQAGKQLNLNKEGQSMPVEVRVLLLRARERFDQLDFETLWKGASEPLGKDLVKSASLTVFPGKLKIFPMKSSRRVAYVALVGIFRRPEGQRWKYVVDVRSRNRRCGSGEDLHTIIHAVLGGNAITRPKNRPAS
jgi:type VI secretion system VasD/TssJ family lipoprotein